MNILNIEHVSKVFGEKVVLDDVSYGVHQGDKIGIIGINGTGKSTILKIIGGLEEPDEGQVITMWLRGSGRRTGAQRVRPGMY